MPRRRVETLRHFAAIIIIEIARADAGQAFLAIGALGLANTKMTRYLSRRHYRLACEAAAPTPINAAKCHKVLA